MLGFTGLQENNPISVFCDILQTTGADTLLQ